MEGGYTRAMLRRWTTFIGAAWRRAYPACQRGAEVWFPPGYSRRSDRSLPLPVRLVIGDATPYDRGFVNPTDLRGVYSLQGRGGTVLQPAINFLHSRPDFPPTAPIMIITDGWCEEELLVPREHCFLLPRKEWKEGAIPLRTSAPVFRVLKEEYYGD